MLNILKSKTKKDLLYYKKGEYIAATKQYIPANKEWFNSVYTYNKKSLKLLPVTDNTVIKLIRAYFNMFSRFLERKNRAPRMRKWQRRLSGRRFWISKPEVKHTSDKVIINLYIYNRQKRYFLRKIRKLLSYKLFRYINKSIKSNSNRLILGLRKFSTKLLSILDINKKSIQELEKFYLNNLIKKSLRKEIFILHFMQSLFFNRLKFTSLYIEPLKIILMKIYKKKVVLNIVKLKTYFLNSDILTQIVTSKTRNRKLRILKVLNASLINIRTPLIHKKLIERETTKLISVQNTLINEENVEDMCSNVENMSKYEDNVIQNKFKESSRLSILNSINNKTISGIRLEASGRLTKRIIAARAISKLRYIGTLKNVDSSFRGLSTVIVRGNTKSNTQLTKLKSKRRIGSFGMKGWVSCI